MTCSCSPLHWHIRSYTVISVRPKPFVLEGWLFRLRHVLFSQATLKNKQSPGNADPAPLRQLCDVLGTGGAGEEPSSAGSSHWALPGWSGRWSVHVSQEDLSTGPFQALPKASAWERFGSAPSGMLSWSVQRDGQGGRFSDLSLSRAKRITHPPKPRCPFGSSAFCLFLKHPSQALLFQLTKSSFLPCRLVFARIEGQACLGVWLSVSGKTAPAPGCWGAAATAAEPPSAKCRTMPIAAGLLRWEEVRWGAQWTRKFSCHQMTRKWEDSSCLRGK